MTRFSICFFALTAMACDTKSSTDTGDTAAPVATPSTPAASSGGCDWMGSYCYDFDGSSWDATSAEAACDTFSAGATAEGAPAGTFVATGCPSGAEASCTGFQADPADPGSSFTLFYYDAVPLAPVESACTDEGGTWTDL
jgi:hypothetical protein